jgi:hypothetical protein
MDEAQVAPLAFESLDGSLVVMTCSTRRPKGSMPVVSSQRPKTFARCTSQAAR